MVHKKKELAQGWISANTVSSSGLLQTYFYLRKELISQTEHSYTGAHLEENSIRMSQLQETYSDHWVQILDQSRADWRLQNVNKVIVQMPLEYWQVWGLDRLSRSLFQHLDTLLVKKCFFMPSLDPSLTQLWTVLGVLSLEKSSALPSLLHLLRKLQSNELAALPS